MESIHRLGTTRIRTVGIRTITVWSVGIGAVKVGTIGIGTIHRLHILAWSSVTRNVGGFEARMTGSLVLLGYGKTLGLGLLRLELLPLGLEAYGGLEKFGVLGGFIELLREAAEFAALFEGLFLYGELTEGCGEFL